MTVRASSGCWLDTAWISTISIHVSPLLAPCSWLRPSELSIWSGSQTYKAVTMPTAPTSAWTATQQLRHSRPFVVTQAGLNKQRYWRSLEEYATANQAHWEEQLKKAGIQPLTARQQCSRYVGSWLGAPLHLDPALRRTSAIMPKLDFSLTPRQLQLLLGGDIDDPALHLDLSKDSRWAAWDPDAKECSYGMSIRNQLQQYSLDHIIPSSRTGQHHPRNYFLMPREVNTYFGNSWTAEKVAYIGLEAAQAAGSQHAGWSKITLGGLQATRRSKAMLLQDSMLGPLPSLWLELHD